MSARLARAVLSAVILAGLLGGGLGAISWRLAPRGERSSWLSVYLQGASSGLLVSALTFGVVALVYDASSRRIDERDRATAEASRVLARALTGRAAGSEVVDELRAMGHLTDGTCSRLSFAGVDMTNSNFDGAVLVGCDFSGSILRDASFVGANVNGANFAGAVLGGAALDFLSAEGASFHGAVE